MHRRHFLAASLPALAAKKTTRILIVQGPTNHPPGTHEVAAGARLMAHCLRTAGGIDATVATDWPAASELDPYAAFVFIGDVFPPLRMPDSGRIMAGLENQMSRGKGIACIHYATGLQAKDVPPSGDHPLLRWMGGYFSTGGAPHHKSVARVFPSVTISPASGKHPILRGWREFTLPEEPYYNNYFGPDNNRMAPNVTALATALLPPESPKPETVAWCVQRPDGGRGFAVVMPHFYRTWANDDFRRLALNGIAWSAKFEIPKSGIQTPAPDLAAFQPDSIEPKSRPAKSTPR